MRGYRFLLPLLAAPFLLAACNLNQPPNGTLSVNALTLRVQVAWNVADPEGDAFGCTLEFGDGEKLDFVSCPQSYAVVHTYKTSGSFNLRLRLKDAFGQSRTISKTITLPAPPEGVCPAPPAQASVLSDADPQGVAFAANAATVPGRLLVRLPENAPGVSALASTGVSVLGQVLPQWVVLEVARGQELDAAQRLTAAGLVQYAQPVYRYRLLASPNDPLYASYQAGQFAQMQLTAGWDLLSNAACRPIVAVVDTGADLDHEDLAAHLLPGYDISDDDADPDDPDGHGTMVSGIIGAVTDNNVGVAGSTQNLAYVLPVKVFPNATSDVIAEGIRWAADAGAHLVNLSLCVTDSSGRRCADMTGSPDAIIEDALRYAYRKGVIALAASGNDGNGYVGYPASSAYTIAVGSVDSSNTRSSFSNYGADLDFVAPGEAVASTAPAPDDYLQGNGTSFATPYVAGGLALYLGQHYAQKGTLPSFDRAYNCFKENTNQAGWNVETGYGVPQADQFLDVFDATCYP